MKCNQSRPGFRTRVAVSISYDDNHYTTDTSITIWYNQNGNKFKAMNKTAKFNDIYYDLAKFHYIFRQILPYLYISSISNSIIKVFFWLMYSYGPPHMDEQKQDDQLEHTYSSYVRIRDVALKTCQRQWTIGKSGERGSRISVLAVRHDDDDDCCSVVIDDCNVNKNKGKR